MGRPSGRSIPRGAGPPGPEPGRSLTAARLRRDEHEEITRILFAITRSVHLNGDEILRTLDALAVLDLLRGKVQYAQKVHAVCPTLNPQGTLELRQARHPVLIDLFAEDEAETVVPIDIRLGDDFDVLVITGPNTGGKTVTLKTVGLLALMTQCGIPIPAGEGSKMPIFKEVFAADAKWRELIPRLVKAELLPDDSAVNERIVSQ